MVNSFPLARSLLFLLSWTKPLYTLKLLTWHHLALEYGQEVDIWSSLTRRITWPEVCFRKITDSSMQGELEGCRNRHGKRVKTEQKMMRPWTKVMPKEERCRKCWEGNIARMSLIKCGGGGFCSWEILLSLTYLTSKFKSTIHILPLPWYCSPQWKFPSSKPVLKLCCASKSPEGFVATQITGPQL